MLVYHTIHPTFEESHQKVLSLSDFKPVAQFQLLGMSLEQAFKLTHTLHWWKNQGLTFLGSPDYGMEGCRSTSVGDLIEHRGKFFEVSRAGFKEVIVQDDFLSKVL